MKKRLMAGLAAAVLSAACMLGAAGCAEKQVAANVAGVDILEQTITTEISNMRASNGLDSDEDWAAYLKENGYTVESLRQEAIDSYVEKELVKKAASENEVTVDEAAVQAAVEQMKSNYSDDAAWQDALKKVGLTEEEYKDNIESTMMRTSLMEKVVEEQEASKEDILMYAQLYSSYTWNGGKKSSHILFNADDEETAKKVLEQIKDGSITFKKAAKKYSQDAASAADGGNVGWDCLNSFVAEYTDALADLEKGQVSDLVKSQFGYHIIKCTDEYTAPENITKVSQIPDEMVDYLKTQISGYNRESKFDEWLSDYKEKTEVVVNEMPADLPYYVEVEEDSSDSSDSSEASSDEEQAAAGNGETGAEESTEAEQKEAE